MRQTFFQCIAHDVLSFQFLHYNVDSLIIVPEKLRPIETKGKPKVSYPGRERAVIVTHDPVALFQRRLAVAGCHPLREIMDETQM